MKALSALEGLVLRSPSWVRTAAANAMAFRQRRFKQGGDWPRYLHEFSLAQYHDRPWEALREEQSVRLVRMVERARECVPFYRELYAGRPALRDGQDLAALPTVSKDRLRSAGADATDRGLMDSTPFVTLSTSGSTGTPFRYLVPIHSSRARFACRDTYYLLHGFDFRELNIRIGGRLFMAPSLRKPPFWIRDFVSNQLMFSTWHMNDAGMESLLEPIRRHRPAFVTGYPSMVALFAGFCRARGFEFTPKGVFTDSETLLESQRATIESAWGCTVHDAYGMETGWLAGQCRLGKYHLSPFTSIIEILKDDDIPQELGAPGEIVCTDLTNPLQPFIRYRTGDLGAWSAGPCPCGWNTPAMDTITGRMDDLIILEDGTRIGRMDHVFKGLHSIREAQIIQEEPSRIRVSLVPEEGYSPQVETTLRVNIAARLGARVHVDIALVGSIPRQPNGKFRSVISRVH